MHISLVDMYSKEELQKIVDDSLCLNDVLRTIGYSTVSGNNHLTIKKRLESDAISTDHFRVVPGKKRSDSEVFCENSEVSQCVLRRRYSKISDNSKCAICGQSIIWNDKPLTMTLDHINGNKHDNKLENLRWICPNCGSQLDTFGARNFKNIHPHTESSANMRHYYYMDKCRICGKSISKGAELCKDCLSKERRKDIPTKPELINHLCDKSITDISKEYGVSNMTVRKWCVGYDLPYKKDDIKSQKVFQPL